MKNCWIMLLILCGLSCSRDPISAERTYLPVDQISWETENGWIPQHSGRLSEEICPDTMVFDPTGWNCQGEVGSALALFHRETVEGYSTNPSDRIERILMNVFAGQEASSELADPRMFVATVASDSVWVNQFLPVELRGVGPGQEWNIRISTQYPIKGQIRMKILGRTPRLWTLAFRQPGWTNNAPDPTARYRWRSNRKLTVEIDGEYLFPELQHGYAYLSRVWTPGDELIISFPMSVRRLMYRDRSGTEQMSLEVGPVALATQKDPEAMATLPDQGYLQMKKDSSGVDVWDWTVDGIRYKFYRWPDLHGSPKVAVNWPVNH